MKKIAKLMIVTFLSSAFVHSNIALATPNSSHFSIDSRGSIAPQCGTYR
ncbi:MAG: hypothetical protein H7249_11010 [Chitinophagaceae bacterium]|nr:hypothetical protein [Oligoflexus sp.]